MVCLKRAPIFSFPSGLGLYPSSTFFAYHTPVSSRNVLQPHLLQEAFPGGTDWFQRFAACASEYSVLASLTFTSQYYNRLLHRLSSRPYHALWEGRKHESRPRPQSPLQYPTHKGLKQISAIRSRRGQKVISLKYWAMGLAVQLYDLQALRWAILRLISLSFFGGMKDPWTHMQRMR